MLKIHNWDQFGPLLTLEEVALIFSVTPKTVLKWANNGVLSGKKIGKKWFFEKNKLKEEFLI